VRKYYTVVYGCARQQHQTRVLLESLKEEHVQLRSRSVRLPLCLKAASFDSRVQLRGCCQLAELGTGQVADVQAEAALKRQLE